MSEFFSRRTFLKLSCAVAAATALSACGSSGNGSSEGNVYKEVSSGLMMRAPSGFERSNSRFGINFWFKNTGDSAVTLSTANFTEISCSGQKLEPTALGSVGQSVYQLPAGDEKSVTLYLDTDDVDSFLTIHGATIYNVDVTFTYQGKEAVYSGNIPATTPMRIS